MGLTIVWMTFICVGVLKMVAGRDSGIEHLNLQLHILQYIN